MEDKWNDEIDLLNRKKEGEFLLNYLIKRYEAHPTNPFVLNINAEWGFGKTFFLKNLAKDLENENYPVLYFDAWQNDYTNEPLISFISEMDNLLTPFFNKDEEIKKSFKNLVKSSKGLLFPILIKKLTGHSLDELEDKIEDDETPNDENQELKNEISSVVSKAATLALVEHQTIKNSISEFKENMKVLLESIDSKPDIKLPMFVFIDELDRCRPNYAIELLENIKHIFDIPGITFVVATDSKQLSHSINAVYGNNFASERYLKRFFDQEYCLIKPKKSLYISHLLEKYKIDQSKLYSPLSDNLYINENLIVHIFELYGNAFKFSYRDLEQIISLLQAIMFTWISDKEIHLGYMLFLIMLKTKDNNLFFKFIENNNKKTILKEVFEKRDMDNTISIRSYHNNKKMELNIQKIIMAYIDLYDYDKATNTQQQKIYYSNSDEEVIQDLKIKYITEFQHAPKERMISRLRNYHKLLLNLGQFSL